jgi:hypothetical protein
VSTLESIQSEIRHLAKEKSCDPKKIDRSQRRHKNIKLSKPLLKRLIHALLSIRHNKHELIALIYKVPVIGSILSFAAYSIRIRQHITRLSDAIINCHFEISSSEIRVLQQSHQDFILLHKRIIELEKEVSALKKNQG